MTNLSISWLLAFYFLILINKAESPTKLKSQFSSHIALNKAESPTKLQSQFSSHIALDLRSRND